MRWEHLACDTFDLVYIHIDRATEVIDLRCCRDLGASETFGVVECLTCSYNILPEKISHKCCNSPLHLSQLL